MAPIRYIVSLQIFWKKNPFRTFLYVYIEKDFFLVLEIKCVFFKNPTKPWQEMTNIVFTTKTIHQHLYKRINVDNKRRIERCCVIYSTEHHQREDIARYCSAHFGETINQERKLQDATRNRKVVKIRDSICQTWQEQRYKYNVTLLVKLHLLLIRFFSFCLLSPKKDDKTFPEIVIPSRDVQTLSFGLWQLLPTCSLEHHQLQGHSYKC